MRWRDGRWSAVWFASAVLFAGIAPPASGSNLQLNVGATVSAPPSSCAIFSFTKVGTNITSAEDCTSGAGMEIYGDVPSASQDSGDWTLVAPSGITINQVWVPNGDMNFSDPTSEWAAGEHWANGGDVHWTRGQQATNTIDTTSDMNSQWWQFWLACQQSSCSNSAVVHISGLHIFATETTGPNLIAVGSNNLWYQTGHWIWNPPGDPWPAALVASDPTGVCAARVSANGAWQSYGPLSPNQNSGWQQCPQLSWGSPVVDTQGQLSDASGPLDYEISASNAAGISTALSETLNVDNVPPTVSLTPANDSNPGGWAVNHAVTIHAAAQTGPSGLAGITCTIDGKGVTLDSNDDFTVDGNGQHAVSCTAANKAVDPQGQPNTGTATMAVDIDEQPPTLSFAPEDPNNPAQAVVDTSDSESPVAGGGVEIAPQGTTNWRPLKTELTSNGQLLATIPDARLHGPYTIQAVACSVVGNCGTTSEVLTLPLRAASASDVSFASIANAFVAKRVKERVRVGWHWAAVLRHGKAVKVKRGGHWKTITVIKRVESCTHRKVKIGKHRWRVTTACEAPRIKLQRTAWVRHGHRRVLNGLLETGERVALAHAPVEILTAPDSSVHRFTRVATTTTNKEGVWSVKLPAGPSRIVRAVYPGSATILPATGTGILIVPAKIVLSASPRSLPWSHVVTFKGRLVGGYVPRDGVALRLLVRYPGARKPSSILALRTNRRGRFKIRWSYNAGRGVAAYPFQIATTANESDYPFAASTSRPVRVTFTP